MLQKSCSQPPVGCIKPCKQWDFNYPIINWWVNASPPYPSIRLSNAWNSRPKERSWYQDLRIKAPWIESRNFHLGDGFKYFWCSSRTLGIHDPTWRAYVSNGLVQPPTSHVFFVEGQFGQVKKNNMRDKLAYKVVYKWYILPIGWLYITYHLLREPETAIDIEIFLGRWSYTILLVLYRYPHFQVPYIFGTSGWLLPDILLIYIYICNWELGSKYIVGNWKIRG